MVICSLVDGSGWFWLCVASGRVSQVFATGAAAHDARRDGLIMWHARESVVARFAVSASSYSLAGGV